jgi:periplasmic protein CpxP/Spy
MTTRRKTILAISAALALGLVAAPLLLARGAARHLGHGPGGHAMKFMKLAGELDLTDEQKEALHRIHDVTFEKNKESREALHEGFTEAARILIANPQNVDAARTAIANRQAAIVDLRESALTAVSQGLAVLTPEQRAKLAEHVEKHLNEHSR